MKPTRSFRPRTALPLLALLGGLWISAPGGDSAWGQGGVDTTPPVIHLLEGGTEITEGRKLNHAAHPAIEVTDESTLTLEATLDGSPFVSGSAVSGEGTHQLAVTATDAAGNVASASVGFEIDTTPPLFGTIAPADASFTAAGTVTLSGSVTGAVGVTVDGAPATLNGDTFNTAALALAPGLHTFALVATDAAGNSAQRSLRVNRDSTAPVVSIAQPVAGALVQDSTVDVSGTVVEANLATLTVNGTTATVTGQTFLALHVPLSEGPVSLVVRAVDRAGTATEAARTVTRDSEAPEVTVTDPAPGTVVPGATIVLRGTALDPHLDRVEVGGARAQLAGSAWSFTVNLAAGANTFAVRAFDRVGNSSATEVSVTRDSEAPAVHIDQPAQGARLSSPSVAVSGTVDQEAGLTLTVNGTAATIAAGHFTVAGIALVEGENTLIARARDAQGNEGTHTRKVTRDTVALRLLTSDPASGALAVPAAATFRLHFGEALAAPIDGDVVLQTGSGQTLPSTVSAAGDDLTLVPGSPLPSATQVRIVLGAGLRDLAGNALASAPVTLTFLTADTAAPGAPTLSPTPPTAVCAPSLSLSGGSEAGALVRALGGAAAAETRADETGHFTLSVSLLPETGNRLQLMAVDSGGNASAPRLVEVTHDCRPPQVVKAERQGSTFRLGFSEPIAAASLDGAVRLGWAEGAIPGSAQAGSDGRSAIFTPSVTLPAGPLRLEVTTAIRDLAGNALAYPWSQVFGAAGGTGFLTGTVIDDASGRPLAGARVVVYATNGAALPEPRPEQVTGSDGRFRLPVSAGTHDVTFARNGYTPVFRVVTAAAGRGTDVFDPRLTPNGATASIGTAGGAIGEVGEATGDTPPAAQLTLPAGALEAATGVTLTDLSEQGLPALLPYGWSPRGGAWLSLSGAALLSAADLSLPVEAANGRELALVHLDLSALVWRVVGEGVATDGRVVFELPAATAGSTDGAWVAVEADFGDLAPPAAVVGSVLSASTRPQGDEPTAAVLAFNPEVVLPAQASRATATYTLSQPAASGLPLTLSIVEELTLLDDSVRRQAPYEADLVLYHAPDGAPRSRFWLRPSGEAQSAPLRLGAENVALRTYGGDQVAGNVVGPEGGTVSDDEGDRIDLPAGALVETTAIGLSRHAGSLGVTLPSGTELAGAIDLDFSGNGGGSILLAPAAVSLALSPAPATGEQGLLLQIVQLDGVSRLRPVAEIQPTATGWTTKAIDVEDLAWPGVTEGGTYLFVRRTAPLGFARGVVSDVGGAPLAAALVTAAPVSWIQLADAQGRYVLPLGLGSSSVAAENRTTGNRGSGTATLAAADDRFDLDLSLLAVGPRVISTTPADGAAEVVTGIEPTVRFTEPVDPASLAAGLQLRRDGQPVAVTVSGDGTLARVVPHAALEGGTEYELRITGAILDLQGNPLTEPEAIRFTTKQILLPSQLDLSRIFLIEPDASGEAHILGHAGAVPAGTSVFAENLTAPAPTNTVAASQNGGFDLPVEATLSDRIVLHVLIPGSNEVATELTPFRTPDLRGAYVGSKAQTYTTGDGFEVKLQAGTFDGPTRLRVEPTATATTPTLARDAFAAVTAFRLDFGGAEARKALGLRIPLPSGAPVPVGGFYLLNRQVEALGEDAWMMHDLLRQDGAGYLTTAPPASAAFAPAGSQLPEAIAQVAALDSPFGLVAKAAKARPAGPLHVAAADVYLPRHKMYVPGAAFPGQYQLEAPTIPLGFVAFPSFASSTLIAAFNLDLEGMVAVVNASIERLLEGDGILLPARLDRPLRLEVRDLSTGFRLFEGSFDAPTGPDITVLPHDVFGDQIPPVPVSGSPLRFFALDLGVGDEALDLAPGLTARRLDATATGYRLQIQGASGATATQAYVRLLGLDGDGVQEGRSDTTGAFTLERQVTNGQRFLLAVGGLVQPGDRLTISFSEALGSDLSAIDVRDASGRSLSPTLEPAGSRETFTIRPASGWRAGETYTLVLGPGLADDTGNRWNKSLSLPFEVAKSRSLDTFALNAVRDVARLGSLLFVAADDKGMYVLDASNPAQLRNVLNADLAFPFPLADPVRGVAVDPHGRVLIAGGGVNGFGQLKIFDALALTPAAIAAINADPNDAAARTAPLVGSTILSDKLGGPGTQLPAGTPRRVAILSNDDKDEWREGEAAPAGITVQGSTPSGGFRTVTVSGANGTAGHPISVYDLDLGRWTRVDADAQGHFQAALEVQPGDRLRLLRNRQTLAYVATQGVGIEVVDVDKFYRGSPRPSPIAPSPQSDVVGIYSGYQDPKLVLCGEHVSDLGSALIDLDGLFDAANPHPLTTVGLVGSKGLVLVESNATQVGLLSFVNDVCADSDGSTAATGLDVVQKYRFDLDGDGQLEASEERDYAVVSQRQAGLLIYDVTDRENISWVGRIKVPGTASQVSIDAEHRRAYVSGGLAGLFVVDFDRVPSRDPIDRNGDGIDDRVLETIALPGTTNAPVWTIPELGVVLAGGLQRGVTSISVAEPVLRAMARGADGTFRPIGRLAPFGVPTAKETSDPAAPNLPGSFQVEAHLPGSLGAEIRLDLLGVGPDARPVQEMVAENPSEGLPRAQYTGDHGVVLRRLSDHPADLGYSVYRSGDVAALADPRASRAFARTAEETEACRRCDLGAEQVGEQARELLSGDGVAIRYPASLRAQLASTYSKERLDAAELTLGSVRWDAVPAVHQEPLQSPAFAGSEAFPGTLVSSAEVTLGATDLTLKGRGLDFALTRFYRSQTIGAGPLGPGWELGFRQRLRELPNGEVEHYDGTGRRELWTKEQDGTLKAPKGRFATLDRTASGWVLVDARHDLYRFDRFGRWTSLADAVKDAEGTGNELRFGYDLDSRLVRITDSLDRIFRVGYDAAGRIAQLVDPTGRQVHYAYDTDGRLEAVQLPAIAIGLGTFPQGLTTHYAYVAPSGTLAQKLASRDNLASITDGRSIRWLELTYGDENADGRPDEVTAERIGAATAALAYDFSGRETTITDRRGHDFKISFDADGHPTRREDPTGAATTVAYDAEGLPTSLTLPLGGTTTLQYSSSNKRRSRGNLVQTTATADARGSNGSAASRTSQVQYEERTNQPTRIVDPRGTVTTIERLGTGLVKTVTVAPQTSVAATTRFTWNAFGQPETIVNANGHTTSLHYTQAGAQRGYLESVAVDPAGLNLVTRLESDDRGNTVATIDPRGIRHARAFNELDWLVKVQEPLGLNLEVRFDAAGQAVEERLPYVDGNQTTSVFRTFGPLGELLSEAREILPGGEQATDHYGYDENLNLVLHTAPEGQTTAWQYDERNLPTLIQRGAGTPEAAAMHLVHDAEGQVTVQTDPRGGVWSTVFDGFGRTKESSDPLGQKATFTYDDGDLVLGQERLDAEGHLLARSHWSWDARGRSQAAQAELWTAPTDAHRTIESRTEYDPLGNVLRTLDPLGRTTEYTYDGAERVRSTADPVGNTVSVILDGQGNPTQTTTRERLVTGHVESVESAIYDDLGRPTKKTDAVGAVRRFLYDVRGNLLASIDPEENLSSAVYDGLDRTLRTVQPEGITVDYLYDLSGRLSSYKDARNQVTSWLYDALDRPTKVTYPDNQTLTTQYDRMGNPVSITDARGTAIAQAFDLAGRLLSRTSTPSEGVEGITSQTFSYDGLNRLTHAQAGDVATDRAYDSLSRSVAETQDGKAIHRTFSDVGDLEQLLYPSGYRVDGTYDALGLPLTLRAGNRLLVQYGWRGYGLPAQKDTGNGLTGAASYDLAGRLTEQAFKTPDGLTAFGEKLGWNPRGLQTSSSRTDLNGAGWSRAYDGAGRLAQAASTKATPAAADAATLAGLPNSVGYQYDAAQNLLSRTVKKESVPEQIAAPLDGSGRNRPASIHDKALEWDANGNLTRKGDRFFHYDTWNRLVRVTNGSGTTLASYTYDAFNRRVKRQVGNLAQTTVWNGWQAIEDYAGEQLGQRTTYGAKLDEVVSLETDPAGIGTLSPPVVPTYDLTGNVTAATGADGKPIERYEYTPYGEVTVRVDATPPAVQQLRVKDGALWLELSEEVSKEALDKAVADHSLILEDTTHSQPVPYALSQPVQEGKFARTRVVLTPTAAPEAGVDLHLKVPAGALRDLFLNHSTQQYEKTFAWPGSETVVEDEAVPQLDRVAIRNGVPEITLTEEPDANTLSSLKVDGTTSSWTLSPDRHTLVGSAPMSAGSHTIAIESTVADLSGKALANPWSTTTTVATQETKELYATPDPREVPSSTIGNAFAFQGLPKDAETGFVYIRNRYYDPEMGRFVTVDPLGYVDGPNPYGFAKNDPVNGSDPLGLAANCLDLPPVQAKACIDASGVNRRVLDDIADWWVKREQLYEQDLVAVKRHGARMASEAPRREACASNGCIGSGLSRQERFFEQEEREAFEDIVRVGNRRITANVALDYVTIWGSPTSQKVGPGPQRQLVHGAPVEDLARTDVAAPLPNSLGAAANFELNSKINRSPYAVRTAEAMSEAAQRDIDLLKAAVRSGNLNAGAGFRGLERGYIELRGRNAGRMIVIRSGPNSFDIVGKFQGHAGGDLKNSLTIRRLISEYERVGAK